MDKQKEFDEVGRKIAELQKKFGIDSIRLVDIKNAYEVFSQNKTQENFNKLNEEVTEVIRYYEADASY